jgi:hypothetical protein
MIRPVIGNLKTMRLPDVMFSVLIFVPFAIYFIYLARKVARTLDRIEKRENGRENKDDTGKDKPS